METEKVQTKPGGGSPSPSSRNFSKGKRTGSKFNLSNEANEGLICEYCPPDTPPFKSLQALNIHKAKDHPVKWKKEKLNRAKEAYQEVAPEPPPPVLEPGFDLAPVIKEFSNEVLPDYVTPVSDLQAKLMNIVTVKMIEKHPNRLTDKLTEVAFFGVFGIVIVPKAIQIYKHWRSKNGGQQKADSRQNVQAQREAESRRQHSEDPGPGGDIQDIPD